MSHHKPKNLHKEYHKKHWGLLIFGILLCVFLLVLKGEHLAISTVFARLSETAVDLLLEHGWGLGES